MTELTPIRTPIRGQFAPALDEEAEQDDRYQHAEIGANKLGDVFQYQRREPGAYQGGALASQPAIAYALHSHPGKWQAEPSQVIVEQVWHGRKRGKDQDGIPDRLRPLFLPGPRTTI